MFAIWRWGIGLLGRSLVSWHCLLVFPHDAEIFLQKRGREEKGGIYSLYYRNCMKRILSKILWPCAGFFSCLKHSLSCSSQKVKDIYSPILFSFFWIYKREDWSRTNLYPISREHKDSNNMEVTWHWQNKGKRGSMHSAYEILWCRSVVTVTTGLQSMTESPGGPPDVAHLIKYA